MEDMKKHGTACDQDGVSKSGSNNPDALSDPSAAPAKKAEPPRAHAGSAAPAAPAAPASPASASASAPSAKPVKTTAVKTPKAKKQPPPSRKLWENAAPGAPQKGADLGAVPATPPHAGSATPPAAPAVQPSPQPRPASSDPSQGPQPFLVPKDRFVADAMLPTLIAPALNMSGLGLTAEGLTCFAEQLVADLGDVARHPLARLLALNSVSGYSASTALLHRASTSLNPDTALAFALAAAKVSAEVRNNVLAILSLPVTKDGLKRKR